MDELYRIPLSGPVPPCVAITTDASGGRVEETGLKFTETAIHVVPVVPNEEIVLVSILDDVPLNAMPGKPLYLEYVGAVPDGVAVIATPPLLVHDNTGPFGATTVLPSAASNQTWQPLILVGEKVGILFLMNAAMSSYYEFG